MSKRLWQVLKTTPAVACTSAVLINSSAMAQTTPRELAQTANISDLLEQVDRYNQQESSLDQVNSVTQFSDVQPTDWAYEALRGLVERYGCIAGYPNGTYRGNRAMTRYEFAAGLYACLLQIERLIAANTSEVSQEDLAALERLVIEFEAELATLGTRVDNLEARLETVEENQFSTTTKLDGEVIFAVADAFGDDVDDINTVFHDRVRLNFLTSFTGQDLLQTRLQASSATPLLVGELGTQEGRFTYDGSNGNNVEIDILRYIFPLGDNLRVQILANDALHHYYVDTVNPFFEGRAGGENAISRFAERNPIYRIGPFGAGAAVAYTPTEALRFDLGYIANEAEDPSEGAGLFNGSYSAIAQAVIGNRYKLGLTYVHAYNGTTAQDFPERFVLGGTGTALANLSPAALAAATGLPTSVTNTPVESNSYGIETSLGFSDNFFVNGWVGMTDAELIGLGDATIWNFAVGAAFPNFGKPGNLLGIIGGAAPTLRDLDIDQPGIEPDFSDDFAYHVEAFYKYRVNDNISVTPGVIWLPAVNQNEDNEDVFVGTVRTTFGF